MQADGTTSASSPGDFFDFPGQNTAGTQDMAGVPPIGKPCLVDGDEIILPISRANPDLLPTVSTYATLYVGSGLPTPASWDEVTATGGIDPDQGSSPLGPCSQIGASFWDAINGLYVVYLWIGTGNNVKGAMRLCHSPAVPAGTPNDWVWTGQTVWDIASSPNPYALLRLAFPAVQVSGDFVLIQSDGQTEDAETAFWFGNFGPAPSPAPAIRIALYGYKIVPDRSRCELVEVEDLPPVPRVL